MDEQSIFLAALEIEDTPARRSYLDEACGGDPDLRSRIDALLAAHDGTQSFMNQPAASNPFEATTDIGDVTAPRAPAGPAESGQLLAERYLVGEEIGRGGMGTVYRAEQIRPVRRPVAVKLVNPGMDTRAVLARFEAERQALAVMEHPNIARVLDAGTTPDGRPFFVMELVKGVPLTEFCDGRRLPMNERLELFRKVCGAVQHAHQKGIIHRDLKPSNVLVEEHDGQPSPKVIDFGLAKAFGGMALTEETMLTAPSGAIGTPLYMAPEQAGPDSRDVDTRADVYALGAILYELLTGGPPFSRESLCRAALHEVLRVIREDEPPPPSSRLSSSAELPSVAANRRSEPARLSRFVRGDLDWVTLKALEKDRSRRYESAAALGADVERFLNHEAVAAGPPTLRYRAGKFIRRNRAAVTAASLVFVALVVGVVGTTLALLEARRQRTESEANLAFATKGNDLLTSIFTNLDPDKVAESGRPLQDALRDNLRAVARDLEAGAIGDPLTTAAMLDKLGNSLVNLGDYESAASLFTKVAESRTKLQGPTHRDTLNSKSNLAQAHRRAGRLDLALPLIKSTLASMRATLGPDDPDTIACQVNLGGASREAGQVNEAVKILEETRTRAKEKLGPDDARTLMAMDSLANAYADLGRADDAIRLWQEIRAHREARLGPDHPLTLTSMDNLAQGYEYAGRLAEAVPLWEESMRRTRAALGPDNPETLVAMNNLANGYRGLGRTAEAIPIHEEALRMLRIKLGVDHPTTLKALNNLAGDHFIALDYGKAAPLFEQALELRKAKLGPGHPDVIKALINLATSYRDAGQTDRAVPLYREAIAVAEKSLGRARIETQTAVAQLGAALVRQGKYDDALPLLDEAHRSSRKLTSLRWVSPILLDEYVQLKRKKDVLALVPELVADVRGSMPKDSPDLAARLSECSFALILMGESASAEPYLRELLAIREKAEPDKWTTFNTHSLLGDSLLAQKKFAEAEPFLLRGYEGLTQREKSIPPQFAVRITQALDRLVALYNAWGRPADAARWKAIRDKTLPAAGSR